MAISKKEVKKADAEREGTRSQRVSADQPLCTSDAPDLLARLAHTPILLYELCRDVLALIDPCRVRDG